MGLLEDDALETGAERGEPGLKTLGGGGFHRRKHQAAPGVDVSGPSGGWDAMTQRLFDNVIQEASERDDDNGHRLVCVHELNDNGTLPQSVKSVGAGAGLSLNIEVALATAFSTCPWRKAGAAGS
jgi:hypothetical protein